MPIGKSDIAASPAKPYGFIVVPRMRHAAALTTVQWYSNAVGDNNGQESFAAVHLALLACFRNVWPHSQSSAH